MKMFKGVPEKSDEWNMKRNKTFWVGVDNGSFCVEIAYSFPVVDGGCPSVKGVEFLLGMGVNGSLMGFAIDRNFPEMFIHLIGKTNDKMNIDLGPIGMLPSVLAITLEQAWGNISDIVSKKYDVILSTVKEQMDPSRLMGMADDVDDMSEYEFNKVMEKIEMTMGQPVYTVKIGFEVPGLFDKEAKMVLFE